MALNLAGVSRDEVRRGDVVVAGEELASSFRVDVALAWATPDARPDGGTRVAVHHGTRESPARLTELGGRYFQLRLEQPLVPARGDRVVIRSLAPPDTLGGGVVLDPDPPRHGPSRDLLARLARLERGEPEPEPEPRNPPPRRRRAELAPLTPAALALEQRLREAGHEPPPDDDPGRARRPARARHGRPPRPRHAHPPRRARRRHPARHRAHPAATARSPSPRLRDELQTSRRYAQALLELLDAERVTLARRRRARAAQEVELAVLPRAGRGAYPAAREELGPRFHHRPPPPSPRAVHGPGASLVLRALDLTKSYDGAPLFEGLSLTLNPGDRAGLVGPNGAGKSTLLRLLAGRELADRGSLFVTATRRLPAAGGARRHDRRPPARRARRGRRGARRAPAPRRPRRLRARPRARRGHRRLGRRGARRGRPPPARHRPPRRRPPAQPPVGRRAGPRAARRHAAAGPRRPAARRAHQPPRRRRARLARGVPGRLRRRRPRRLPRPALPRRRRHPHLRARRRAGAVRGRLHRLPRREGPPPRAARGARHRAGQAPPQARGRHRRHARLRAVHRAHRLARGRPQAQALRQEGREEGEGARGPARARDGVDRLGRAPARGRRRPPQVRRRRRPRPPRRAPAAARAPASCATSTSRSTAASASRSPAPTAPARRRCCSSCSARWSRATARSHTAASVRLLPQRPQDVGATGPLLPWFRRHTPPRHRRVRGAHAARPLRPRRRRGPPPARAPQPRPAGARGDRRHRRVRGRPAAARRAHQPPRLRHARGAGDRARRQPEHDRRRLPRPLVPRRDRHHAPPARRGRSAFTKAAARPRASSARPRRRSAWRAALRAGRSRRRPCPRGRRAAPRSRSPPDGETIAAPPRP